jgi:hypothetical protein
MKNLRLLLVLAGCMSVCVPASHAQWQTQTLTLQPGWNAVFLSVDPAPSDCDALFGANARIQSVRRWAPPPIEAVQYDETTGAIIPQTGSWLAWFPTTHTNRALVNLSLMAGGASYLIEVSAGTQVGINLTGRPLVRPYEWQPGSHHFIGLPVFSSAVTFSAFFTPASNAIPTDYRVGGELYTVLASGAHQVIATPTSTGIVPGTAYWIKALEYSTYAGPLSVKLDTGPGWMDFGRKLLPQYLEIHNNTTAARGVKLTHSASTTPPVGTPALSGLTPLKIAVITGASEAQGRVYTNFVSGWTHQLPAGATLRLAFIPDAQLLVGNTNAAFQSIVEVTDDVGTAGMVRQRFGVRAMARQGSAAESVGLWVGEVTVNKVGRVRMPQATPPQTEISVARPFNFRILAHVDSTGKARLLQRVFVGTRPDTANGGVVTDLLATEARVSAYKAQYPGAKVFRMASANFPFMAPMVMTNGAFGVPNQLAKASLMIHRDDPVNPFRHSFAPLHDNMEQRAVDSEPYSTDFEVFSIQRDIQLQFKGPDDVNPEPQWGETVCGGNYSEQVYGLGGPLDSAADFRADRAIWIQGRFVMQRASTVGTLLQ